MTRLATRRAAGLEAALIDNDLCLIEPLDPEDTRTVTVRVARPTALIIAKLHDRIDDERRLAIRTPAMCTASCRATVIATMGRLLTDLLAGGSVRVAPDYLDDRFGARLRPASS